MKAVKAVLLDGALGQVFIEGGPRIAHFRKMPDPFQGVAVGGTDIATQARFVALPGDDETIAIRFSSKYEKFHDPDPFIVKARPPWRASTFIKLIEAPTGIDLDQPLSSRVRPW